MVNIIKKGINIFLFLSLCFYLLCIIYVQSAYVSNYMVFAGFVGVGYILLAFLCSAKIKSDKVAMLTLVIINLIGLVAWSQWVKPVPVSDYRVLVKGANSILDENFYQMASDKTNYFSFYNFQIPYAFYISVLLKLFGSVGAVTYVEIAVIVLTNIVLFKTLRFYKDTGISLFVSLLFAFFPFISLGSGILNNQHECLLFEALSVYTFLKCDRMSENLSPIMCILSAVLLQIANTFRPTASIVFIAIMIVMAVQLLASKSKNALLRIIVFIVAYIAAKECINYCFTISQIAPYGIKSSNLWFKLSLGLTGNGITQISTTDAEHTNLYYDLQYYGFDYNAYQAAAYQYIIGLTRQPVTVLKYVFSKMVNFSGAADNQVYFTNPEFINSHGNLISILNLTGVMFYFISIAGTLYNSINLFRKRVYAESDGFFLFSLVFIGYFFAYCLLETQTRYRYEQYYFLFLMGIPLVYTVLSNVYGNIIGKLKVGHSLQ